MSKANEIISLLNGQDEGVISDTVVMMLDKIAPKYIVAKNLKSFKSAIHGYMKKGESWVHIKANLVQDGFPVHAVDQFVNQLSKKGV